MVSRTGPLEGGRERQMSVRVARRLAWCAAGAGGGDVPEVYPVSERAKTAFQRDGRLRFLDLLSRSITSPNIGVVEPAT